MQQFYLRIIFVRFGFISIQKKKPILTIEYTESSFTTVIGDYASKVGIMLDEENARKYMGTILTQLTSHNRLSKRLYAGNTAILFRH